ncbi:MAG: hypothetical protein CL573_01615 [Alphaproteobacteria bacterium]|nr:hypothetical protein [Alphaproteobacteria bacterium]
MSYSRIKNAGHNRNRRSISSVYQLPTVDSWSLGPRYPAVAKPAVCCKPDSQSEHGHNGYQFHRGPLILRLRNLGIPIEIHPHPALHALAAPRKLRGAIPGAHTKNLFLRYKKRHQWLVTVLEDTIINLTALRHTLGTKGILSFGSADLVAAPLGVAQGSVTPFADTNDPCGAVKMILGSVILDHD